MSKLIDIVGRSQPPTPWAEGENIPWSDPAFSERMLREHLNQDHDLASRRVTKIDRHVDWVHRIVLEEKPTKILDLACGPGLYTNRLAKLGHECVGVDFSPASIAYAVDVAEQQGLRSRYLETDVRSADPGHGFGLVMMLWGQINVFRRNEAAEILGQACQALTPGGHLLLEPQRYEHIKSAAEAGPSWYSSNAGLFSDRPHLVLQESSWDESARTSTIRFYVIDAETGTTARHAMSNVAYEQAELEAMLSGAGFQRVRILRSLTGADDDAEPGTLVLQATK